jgi:hypothetical protein
MYCYIYFLVLFVFDRYRLDAIDFDNLQDLELEDLEQQVVEQGN